MSSTRKWLSLLLAALMMLTTVPVTVLATEQTSNVSISADQTEVSVGDTVTVTLSYGAMTVTSFTAGIAFDKTAMECTGVATASGYTAVETNAEIIAPQISTVTEANTNGTVGFGAVATEDHTYTAAPLLTVTFKALKAGNATFTAYESSDGTDGYTGDTADTVTVTVGEAQPGESGCEHTNTEVIPAVAATCQKTGLTAGLRCTDCGVVLTAQEIVPMTAHTYDNGVCSVCGAANPIASTVTAATVDALVSAAASGGEGIKVAEVAGKTAEEVVAMIKEAATNGTLTTKNEVKEISATAEEKQAVNTKILSIIGESATITKAEVVQYLDLSVALVAGGTELGSVTETGAPVTFSIPLDAELAAEMAGKKVMVLRTHGDEVELIEATLEDGILTFSTDKFSTYAIVAAEEQEVSQDALVLKVVPQQMTFCPNSEVRTVTFNVNAVQNPGVAGAALNILYDANVLTFTDATTGTVSGGSVTTVNANANYVGWEISGTTDCTGTGTLMTLTFTVNDGVTDGTNAQVSVQASDEDEYNITNSLIRPIPTEIVSGAMAIAHSYSEYTPTITDTPATAATCTAMATYYKRCACGAESTMETFSYGEALGHDWQVTSSTVATADAAGTLSYECSRCHATKGGSFTFAEAAVKLTVGTVDGSAKIHRGTIDIPVTIAAADSVKDPSMTFNYDTTRLTLTGVSEGWTLSGNTVSKTGTVSGNGTLCTLTFTVKEDGDNFVNPGDAGIAISAVTIADTDSNRLTVAQTAGKVAVTIAGDIDGSGKVNMADIILLRQYNAKMSVTVVVGSTDIDFSGKTNMADIILLRQYNAKMSVTIY